MHTHQATEAALNASLHFWTGLWQQQFEQSLKVWALWAQALPHPNAQELAAEADAMKAKPSGKAA